MQSHIQANLNRIILIFLILFSLAFWSHGQNQLVEESLFTALKELPERKHDSIYYEIFKRYRTSDIRRAKYYASLTYSLAGKYDHQLLRAKACNALAYVFERENNADSAALFYRTGIVISKANGFNDRLTYFYNDLGALHEHADLYDSALHYFNLSFELAKEINSFKDQAIAKNNIGLVYYHIENYSHAIENLEAALAIKRNHDISDGQSLNLINIAFIYNDQGRYDEALKTLDVAASICKDECDDPAQADLLYARGYSLLKKGNRKEAYSLFIKALNLSRKSKSDGTLAHTLFQLSLFEIENGTFQTALEYLKEAENITQRINLKRLRRDIYQKYSDIYQATGDLDKAISYQNRFMHLKDTLFNSRVANNLSQIEFEAERKDNEEAMLAKELQLKQSKAISYIIATIMVLLFIVAYIIYRTLESNKRIKRRLEEENQRRVIEIDRARQEVNRAYQQYDTLVNATTDEIRGPLSTLYGLANVALTDVLNNEKSIKEYLQRIQLTSKDLAVTMSKLAEINNIRNQQLFSEEINLSEVLQEAYNSFSNLNHFKLISFSFESSDHTGTMKTDRRLLQFIILKLLDNCFKYFNPFNDPKYIKIAYSQNNGRTDIIVEDNGIGIDPGLKERLFMLIPVEQSNQSRMGLFLSQIAASRLQGKLSLLSASNPTRFKLIVQTDLSSRQGEVGV